MVDLSDLIARVEAARGASREIDILVGAAIDLRIDEGHLSFRQSYEICGMDQMLRMAESHQNIWRLGLPRFTASIDAALTLLPEGMDWRVDTMSGLPGAIVCEPNAWLSHKTAPTLHNAATPALALLSAILKARQAAEACHD